MGDESGETMGAPDDSATEDFESHYRETVAQEMSARCETEA